MPEKKQPKPHCIEHKDQPAEVPIKSPMFCSMQCRKKSPFGDLKRDELGYCHKPGHGWWLRADFGACPICVQGRLP